MIDLGEMVGCLEDLITYFAQPDDEMSHEDKQKFLKALKNRQDLFQEEGILNLVLEMIDKMNEISASGMLSSLAGEESGQQWEEVSTYLFQLLAGMSISLLTVDRNLIFFIYLVSLLFTPTVLIDTNSTSP